MLTLRDATMLSIGSFIMAVLTTVVLYTYYDVTRKKGKNGKS